MNIFYEEPKDYNGCNYGIKTDVNGKTIWINWDAWISNIKIDSPKSLKLLPAQIYNQLEKWEKELLKKKEEGYFAPYEFDTNSPKIYFIYEDKVYTIYPNAFKTVNFDYFYGISDIIENDLKEIGCIFTWYID